MRVPKCTCAETLRQLLKNIYNYYWWMSANLCHPERNRNSKLECVEIESQAIKIKPQNWTFGHHQCAIWIFCHQYNLLTDIHESSGSGELFAGGDGGDAFLRHPQKCFQTAG